MTNSDTVRYCTVTREWTRYVGLNGLLLDEGFSLEDKRYRLLDRQLGLPDYFNGATHEEVMIPVD